MKKVLSWFLHHGSFYPVCLMLALLVSAALLVRVNASSSGDDDVVLDREPVETDGEIADGWVYGVLEYRHDIFDPRTLFMLLMAHPDSQVPLITGGYAETDVWVTVEIRGIDVPRGLQSAEVRHRPHRYLSRERARWDRVMGYIWNVCGNSGTFRVGNFEVVEAGKKLRADLEFLLGGQWHDLRMALLNDKLVLPTQADGTEWDFGALEFGMVNGNIPK